MKTGPIETSQVDAIDDADAAMAAASDRAPAYAWYVLALLFLVYCLNFVDRQIISILAEDIKRDLGLADQDLGFLYGTAFGVFYALFGIPLGRLADNWHRVRLLAGGLTLWSMMTVLSGLARSGGVLAGARIGVGVGEATAGPAAFSMISDWFPSWLRATALAIYSAGLYLGVGLSLGIGGLIVKHWNAAYPHGGPLGLAGWQAAFLAVGLAGLPVALWSATLREPRRGIRDGIVTPPHPAPFRDFMAELVTILPPFTLIAAARLGRRVLMLNVIGAGVATLAVVALHAIGEPLQQWVAVGVGCYAIFSWALCLKRRDPPTFALIVASPAMLCTIAGYGFNTCISYTLGFWSAPYALRVLHADPTIAGMTIGGLAATAGFLGVTLGGVIADRLHQRWAAGRLWVVMFGAAAPVPFALVAFTTQTLPLFYACLFCASVCASSALGAAAATTQDLVLPRMRGTTTAAFFIGTTMLGLALGPYIAGRVSTLTGNLSLGVLSVLLSSPLALGAALVAARTVPLAVTGRVARAHAAGEAT